jgi:hypothetical protein
MVPLPDASAIDLTAFEIVELQAPSVFALRLLV